MVGRIIDQNARERQRHQRICSLYSALRSLLPPTAETKKLSTPATVSRMVTYIPELQKEVEKLVQRKRQLLSRQFKLLEEKRVGRQHYHDQEVTSKRSDSSAIVVSVGQLSDIELIIQICTGDTVHNIALSQILIILEGDGLQIQNVNSFESSEGRIFHNLHVKMDGSYALDPQGLREKILSTYKKEEEVLICYN